MLALDGHCKTLDASADGYVRAEACIVLHLLASNPSASTSNCLGAVVLRGTFVNQDGRSSSLTAPNGPAQQGVLRGALAAAGLLPRHIAGLEMHGTGTPLGDPIEVGAATTVLPGAGAPLRFSAAKSRYGHAEPAAGSVGMLHAAAQLGAQCCNSITALSAVNPHVGSSLAELVATGQQAPYLPRQDVAAAVLPLPAVTGAQAAMGVSSFAFQGTNAHVVLGRTAELAPASSGSVAAAMWRHQRFWYVAPPHQMLQRCAAKVVGTATMQCRLSSTPLAFFCDHQVGCVPWTRAA